MIRKGRDFLFSRICPKKKKYMTNRGEIAIIKIVERAPARNYRYPNVAKRSLGFPSWARPRAKLSLPERSEAEFGFPVPSAAPRETIFIKYERIKGIAAMDYQNPYRNNMEYSNGYNTGPGWGPDPEYEKKLARETRRCFSRIGFVYVIFLAVSAGSQWLAALVLAWTGLVWELNENLYMLITMLAMYPVAVPLTALMMKWVPGTGYPGTERWGIGKLAGFFVFSMGVLYAGNIIGTVLMGLAGLIKGEPIINDMQELVMSMETWTVLVTAVITAPIMEELVFRKFLLDRIAGYGHWTAMMVSGVIFGIAHGNFYQFFYAFGLGLIFAYVYLHTGKLRYTIGFHMLINFWGSVLPMGLLKVIESSGIIGSFLAMGNVMIMFGFMICAVVLLICCWRDLSFDRGLVVLSSGKKVRATWLNLGMGLFLLWGALTFALSL